MARRQFGTVRRLSSGRWQARAAGVRRAPAPRTFGTKAEATRWLAGVETDQARGLWVDPEGGKLVLSAYAWSWLGGMVRLAPRTREIYATQLRLHVLPSIRVGLPALGDVPLAGLGSVLVRSWYAALAKERSPSVAAKAYIRLRQILAQAVDDDRIAKNPCRIEGGGVERHPEQRFASLTELFSLADAVPGAYRALVLTAGLAGLRQGELFALRRRDVDLPHGRITVRRKRLRLASGEVIENEPKSQAGNRVIALPAPLVASLEHHMAGLSGADPDDLVFSSSSGAPLERSNFRYRIWVPATEAVGLAGLRFHDLRHTAGTLTARTGATTKEIMARLGHASPRAAMVYQHATEDRDRLIAERLAAMATEAGLPFVPSVNPGDRRAKKGTS
jgi:integrase